MYIRFFTCVLPAVLLVACGGGGGGSGGESANSSPTAHAQSVETSEDLDIGVTLSGSDSDGTIASYEVAEDPEIGTLEGTVPNLTYVPDPDAQGEDSFQFTVTDDDGAESAPATVTITVHSINDPPSATALSLRTEEDTPLSITLSGTDLDGRVFAYHYGDMPMHGYLTGDPPAIEYIPDYEFAGQDSFSYRVEDEDGELSEPALVEIGIDPVNDAPILYDQWPRIKVNRTQNLQVLYLDPDSTEFTFEVTEEPLYGDLAIPHGPDGNPRLRYETEEGYDGEDQLKLVVRDQSGAASQEATMTIVHYHASAEKEKEMLGVFYDETDGDTSWVENTNWKSDDPIREWYAVTVWPNISTRTRNLDLNQNGLSGELTRNLAQLIRPVNLRFAENDLGGEIPPELTGAPVYIEELILRGNDVHGEIPRPIGTMERLRILDLRDNQLTGTIPHTMVVLENLEELRLGNNQFSGGVVPQILPKTLEILDLSSNQFEGPILRGFGSFSNLTHLDLSDSGLSGRLPLSLMSLDQLTDFRYEGANGDICAPPNPDFKSWLNSISVVDNHTCENPPVMAIERLYRVHAVTTGITDRASEMQIWNYGDLELEITITTSHSWLTVSQESINLEALSSANLAISVDCTGADRRIGFVTISTNDPDRSERVVRVDVTCLERDLGVEFVTAPDGVGGGPSDLEFSATLVWQMTSTTDDETPEPYKFSMTVPPNDVMSISLDAVQYGLVTPEENITNHFDGTCHRGGSVTVAAEVRIGSLSDSTEFALICDPDVVRVERLDWYQVPYVATETIEYTGTTNAGGTKTIEYNTPIIPDRRAVVSVTFVHGYDQSREVTSAKWEDATPNSTRDIEAARESSRIAYKDSPFAWSTVHHFHLDADQMTSENSPVLTLQTEAMAVEFRTELSDLEFEQVVPFRPVFLPFVVNQGQNPSPAPDWDDDEMLGDTRDWLPVGEDDPRRYETIWVDASVLPGGFSDNFWVLDETAVEYNRVGEADEFFHGLWFSGLNGHYAGGGVAYLGWQVGMSCVQAGSSSDPNEVVGGTAVVAHEFGHNWSLEHTPCGGPSGPDPDYPYPDATIGDLLYWSYVDDRFVSDGDGYFSFMSYCGPEFTSDYDYRLAAEYFVDRSEDWAQNNSPPPPAAEANGQPRSIALMARLNVETGEWKLLQAEYSTKPPRPSAGGTFELAVLDQYGIESHREPIEMLERRFLSEDGQEHTDKERTWMARVPIPLGGIGSLKVLDELGKEALSLVIDLSEKR